MNPQDPLAQLKDIHLPEPVGWWPLAWGWWLLIALLLIALGLLVWRWRVRRRRQRYRQEALAVLNDAYQRYREEPDSARAIRTYLQTVSELLRRTALSALPVDCHNDIATLNGRPWLRFLDASAPVGDGFTAGPGAVLAQGPYQPNPTVDVEGLDALAAQWIKHHSLNRSTLPQLLAEADDA